MFLCVQNLQISIGAFNWEGCAKDWVEKSNLKADLLAKWLEIPQVPCHFMDNKQAKCKKVVSASYKLVSQ